MVNENTKPRVVIAQMITSPGPAYPLPTLIGEKAHDPRSVHYKNPAFSFGVRHGKFKDSHGPGPCHFPNPKVHRDGQEGTPFYSLYSRQKDIRGFRTPGPGAHTVDNAVCATHPQYPAFSFGSRLRHLKADKTPAANCYSLPNPAVQSAKFQAPSYSLKGRFNLDRYITAISKTPGPGKYSSTDPDIYKKKAPLFSLTSRNFLPGNRDQKPGPGAHMPNKTCTHHLNPEYSFGIRHTEYMTPLIVDLPSIECGSCD
uniref:Uncharacterized protein n=1 Tax=Arion vulgaris TaxID=1028688 RepID=A0A0B7AUF4_9EUPU